MIGKIVKLDFLNEDVLGVVVEELAHEYMNPFLVISRTKFAVTDENIEIIKKIPLVELLEQDISSRFCDQVKIISKHPEGDILLNKTNEYKEKYAKIGAFRFVEEVTVMAGFLDKVEQFALLNVANNKGVYNILHTILTKAK